jgi:hypothetical protein
MPLEISYFRGEMIVNLSGRHELVSHDTPSFNTFGALKRLADFIERRLRSFLPLNVFS